MTDDFETDIAESTDRAEQVWQGLVAGDYDRAVIRIATVSRARINYLIFASVELLPPEVPDPPRAGLSKNCGDDRFYFTRDVQPIADALAWYDGCRTNGP